MDLVPFDLPPYYSIPPKKISTYQFDFQSNHRPLRIPKSSESLMLNEIFSFPGIRVGLKEHLQNSDTTTNEIHFPKIRESYRRKPLEVAVTPVCPLSPSNGTPLRRRLDEPVDSPELLHCPTKLSPTESKVKLITKPTKTEEVNERGTPLHWSRFPKEGCKPPLTHPPRALHPSPKCDCPSSCCVRTACRSDSPVCICGTPCSNPDGKASICNACLCYVFPEEPKTYSPKHYCPRTETDFIECPECKSILPAEPVEVKRIIWYRDHCNVAKTPLPVFRKIMKT